MREVTAEQLSFEEPRKGLGLFEKYLSVWVILCIVAGIFLGEVAPGFAKYLDSLAIYVGEAPVVSIPIAICLIWGGASSFRKDEPEQSLINIQLRLLNDVR
jgi:Na+/H+-dicarboxylate symporter